MRINWKIRFRNKVWLLTFIGAIVAFVYQMLAIFGIAPQIAQEQLMALVTALLNALALVGVIVDPTTAGTGDSDRAMTYGHFDYDEHSSMGKGEE